MGPYIFNDLGSIDLLADGKHAAVIPASDKGYGVQCVGLVKYYSRAGGTSMWKQGGSVMGNPTLARGTAIATFNAKGHYASAATGNHACFFLRFVAGGFEVLEQHVNPNPNMIQKRIILTKGGKGSASNDADAYSVIN